MSEKRVQPYEIMFLLSQAVSADLGGAVQHINELLGRAHAEVIAMRKWDERRLAYEIEGQKRGTYILVYAKLPTEMVSHLERDCNLSEKIMRSLILRVDHLTIEEMQSADARKELETEIKMRGSAPAAGAAPGAAPGGVASAPAAEAAPVEA